jgi:ribosomal protein L37AE/L43A
MTIQPDLFAPMCATVRTVQGSLFTGSAVDDACPTCGRNLVETSSGYWTCPAGCLPLIYKPAADVAPTSGLFTD